jgi:hypothetical protein
LQSLLSSFLAFNLLSCGELIDPLKFNKKKIICIKLNGGLDSLALFSSLGFDKYFKSHISGNKVVFDNKVFDENFFNLILRPCLDIGIPFSIANNVGFKLYNNSHFIASDLWEINSNGRGVFSDLEGLNYTINGGASFFLNQNILTLNDVKQFKAFENILSKKDLKDHYNHQQLRFLEMVSSNPDFDELFNNPFVKSLNLGYDGFDTHSAQDYKLQKNLIPFYHNFNMLIPHLKKGSILLYVYSEFGRTIDVNSSKGTDHGQAGLCLVIGGDSLLHQTLNMGASNSEEIEFIGHKRVLKPLVNAINVRTTISEWLSI